MKILNKQIFSTNKQNFSTNKYNFSKNKIAKFTAILLLILMQFVFIPVPTAHAYSNPVTVNLGTVDSFAAFAAPALGDTGAASLIVGNVGLTPGGGTSYTGITSANVTGTIYAVDSAGPAGSVNNPTLLTTARGDLNTAYGDAAGRTPNQTLNAGDNQLGGQTLTQGVYAVAAASTANIIGTLTLTGDADSVFIFQMASTLVTASSSRVVLSGGVQSCHVFWQVGSSATLNSSTTFVGTILADTTITNPGGLTSTVDGRQLAGAITGSGALTLNHTNITKPTCAAAAGSTSSSSSVTSTTSTTVGPDLNKYIAPSIIESKRIDADSIFVSWGPYSGTDTFTIQYGLENGSWLYSTNVTGFSTTINDLPANLPIWVRIAVRDNITVGRYGESKLVGGPSLPNTGFAPHDNNIPWYFPVGILMLVSSALVVVLQKRTI